MISRSCFCGCEHFRFKIMEDVPKQQTQEPQVLFFNICRNCNHTLAEHLKVTKQAE